MELVVDDDPNEAGCDMTQLAMNGEGEWEKMVGDKKIAKIYKNRSVLTKKDKRKHT
jgi:hypothetical protein